MQYRQLSTTLLPRDDHAPECPFHGCHQPRTANGYCIEHSARLGGTCDRLDALPDHPQLRDVLVQYLDLFVTDPNRPNR